MTATLTDPRPSVAMTARNGRLRERLAGLERPLLLAGLALVALHLLDLAFSGPDTSLLGVLAIVAVPVAWALARPHVTRPTRIVLGVVVGLLSFGFGVISHGLHVVNSGPDWTDVTGVGMIAGGLLLVASGLTAIAAPRRAPRRPALGWRLAHGAGWLAAVPVFALIVVMPFAMVLRVTHAPRWAIQESSLGIPHEEVAIETADGRELSAWYVPSRNRTAVLLSHGSGGSRERVAAHVRMLARHGYGVLALDNPGNGESHGPLERTRLQRPAGRRRRPALAEPPARRRPAADRRLRHLARRRGAARGRRPRPPAARGRRRRSRPGRWTASASATRRFPSAPSARSGSRPSARVSGMREAPSLIGLMPRIAPRPVLLIAGGVGAPDEIPANRAYRDAGGPTTQLWELPDAGHTGGLRTHPAAYEQRTTTFLDRALGLKETS